MADSQVVVDSVATLVYQPVGSRDHVVISNLGKTPAYLGQQYVTAVTGLPLPSGHRLELFQVPSAIYAISGPGASNGLLATTTNAAANKGSTALPVASGGASYTAGMVLTVNTSGSVETVKVASGSTATSIALAAGLQFTHASGTQINQVAGTSNTVLVVTASVV